MKQLKIAMIGFGGIARAHYSAYQILKKENAPISVVAACDCNPAQFDRMLKINTATEPVKIDPSIHTYGSVEELLANEEFDVADICLPSYLHKEYAVRFLRAGYHVLCEKPMALSSEECSEMLAAARESGKRLMIAQCLRFGRTYRYLKQAVEDGTFGRLRRIEMNRLSAYPMWGFENWFCDTEKSGGCILDMHIHDLDMARFLLGEPQAVSTVAYDGISRWQWESTRLYYPDAIAIVNGSWDETKGTPFFDGFRAVFEHATVISQPNDTVLVYPEGEDVFAPELTGKDMYAEEIEYFAKTILEDLPNEVNSPQSAATSVKLVEALRESAARDGKKINFIP